MKLSARNKLKGKITAIEEGLITGKVKIDLGNGNEIVSIISKDAIQELGLKIGDQAFAVIKSTEVLVGVPCDCKGNDCKCH
jgi:molybdopterin-binding protein